HMPQTFPRPTLIAVALTAAFSQSAWSQSAVTVAKNDAPAATVEVKGGTESYDPRKDDTATKIVVTAEEILKHGDTTLADVLKRQPGVTVSGGNAGRGGGEIRMRGLGNGYTQVLLNGEPAPPGFSLDSLTPEMVEKIEIVRAATAEFSTQSIAGTINIVLKKAVKVAQRELKPTIAGAGNFVAPSINFQLSDKDGPLSYSISGFANVGRFDQDSHQLDDGWNSAGERVLQRRGDRNGKGIFANLNLSPRVNYALGGGDTLTSQTFFSLNRVHPDTHTDWTSTIGPLPQYPHDVTRIANDVTVLRSDLNWVRRIGEAGKLDLKIGVNYSDRTSDLSQLGYDADRQLTLDRATPSSAREHGLTLSGKYSQPLAADHTLALGWDGGASRRHEERFQHDAPIPGYQPFNEDQVVDANFARLALFAQDEWNITPRWSVYTGLRWEGLRTTSEGNDFSAMRSHSSVLSPLFQTLWKLPDSKNDQVRFALTRTYKAPALDKLMPRRQASTNNSPTTPDAEGNPALRPELAWGLDASYEHYFGTNGAMLSASTYLRRIDDYTRRDVRLIEGRWVALPVNGGRAQSHGIEMEAKFPLQMFYPQGPDIDLRANLARNWSHVDSVPGPDNRLADQTPLSANLGLDYKADARLTLGGTFTFKTGGLQRVSDVSYSYSTVKRDLDLYALWKFDPKRQLRVSVINALAQPFHSSDLYRIDGTLLQNTQVFPVTPLLRVAYEIKL
ncbi:MAG TPA: TonB-dependent receptor, partial [Telluria sp.]|nr:TonB-dependent receptor [Telluria sp.]